MPSIFKPNFGPAAIYTTYDKEYNQFDENQEQISRTVHYPTHWFYRGEKLKCLTMVEYYAIIEVISISKQVNNHSKHMNDVNSAGRKSNTTFQFHKEHPLFHSHIQRLRSKQFTLIFNAHPPKHPGLPPNKPDDNETPFEIAEYSSQYQQWKKQADAFACYYSILFLPHNEIYGDNPQQTTINFQEYLTWDFFSKRIETMETSKYMIDRQRLYCMYNFIYSLRQYNYLNKQLMENFRF